AGNDYKAITVMRDHAASVAAGLMEISAATCTKCHNDRSPTFKGFNYEEYLAKVAHPDPSK
ncbi:cytochrome C554, partial [Gemmatimonadota bacterium]